MTPRYEVIETENYRERFAVLDIQKDDGNALFYGATRKECQSWIEGRVSVEAPPLQVRIEKPYGHETIYPECEVSRKFADLLGQKTLTRRDVEKIKTLGYEVETVTKEGQKL